MKGFLNRHEAALAARRQALVRASAVHREVLQVQLQRYAPVLAAANTVMAGAAWLRRHGPLVAAGTGVGLLLVRPRRMLRLGMRAWSLWGVYRAWQGRVEAAIAQFQERSSR